ncbi:TPA: transcriptional regulator [Acinetobacter baumannii]|uniref:transcriptional regulator n=1 Tax=Acinetobacter baumannii TaxID=470 RepID=UPI00165FB6AD|nr:transcriptional regulator [Acinetobacter baumannii]EHU1845170.1 transcriptional regulator [Acinetobacter baumannii]EHU2403767.1 transcriptional regulator [Acinetobacter baumannii]EKU5224340.1 transcriptional regulator [Acinetobacter baumannii]EKU6961602.1 transcriptional regulator [Acinetobacter baumannii]EKV1069098.1 transcriptional regulator [Acinetobacter baumannii]
MNALVQNTGFLTPTTLAEAMQVADLLANSEIVPKDYQKKPGNILVAMQWGAEIGLQPLQAMQNIAVINGRPSLWGDAVLALVRSSGLLEQFEETQTEDMATCTVKRKGQKAVTKTFTKEDAKRAGLLSKQGPWTQYPKRMMQMRARGWALRDEFTDILKGFGVAEEERDKEIDVTPEPSKLPKHQGTAGLKAQLAEREEQQDKVVELKVSFDVEKCIEDIGKVENLADLKSLGSTIPSDLGEPAQTDIKNAYANQKFYLQLLDDLEIANSIEAINSIMEKQFEPNTSFLTDAQIDSVSALFERKTAELTA